MTRSRWILLGSLLTLTLVAADTWLRWNDSERSVAQARAPRTFGRYEIIGVEPWCTVPIGRPLPGATDTIPATCAWLSQRHCERSNQLDVATLQQECVPNPLPPR